MMVQVEPDAVLRGMPPYPLGGRSFLFRSLVLRPEAMIF